MKKRAKLNKKVLSLGKKVAKAVELETEEILQDAEELIKKHVPARYVKKALAKLENKIDSEGIEALFDKAVTREALRKTADKTASAEEINEALDTFADAIVAEMEEVLEHADNYMTNKVKTAKSEKLQYEIESKLKKTVEAKLKEKGIYSKFSRVVEKPKTKNTEAQKKEANSFLEKMKQL
jgi:deoxyribodipyrimidine photolyase